MINWFNATYQSKQNFSIFHVSIEKESSVEPWNSVKNIFFMENISWEKNFCHNCHKIFEEKGGRPSTMTILRFHSARVFSIVFEVSSFGK